MNSGPNLRSINPDAVLAARADERLSHAYEQIALADEQLERVTEQLSKLEHGAARQPSAVLGRPPARGRPALRGLAGLVLAGAIGAVAFASQSSYGKTARLTLAQWAPHLVSTSSLWLASPGSFAQPAVRLAAVEALPSQPTPQAQTQAQTQVQAQVQSPAQDAVSPVAASSELAQLVQGMARDLATVELGIEQLKASQERMAADNARVIEQLKANQEQMARLVVKPPQAKPAQDKPAQQDLRAKTPAPLPKPVANAAHKPPPTQPSQARARPQPVQLVPEER